MTLENFTIKAQEAVQEAVNTAQRASQQVIEPVHILKGVVGKAPDVVTFIFQKLGQKHQFFGGQPSSQSNSHIHT